MSKYTAEQVLYAAQLEEDTYDGDLIIVQYLRDYAALLRERESAKAHDLVKTGDADASRAICDRNGEVVLAYCRRCKKGEADLSDTCESTKAAVTDAMIEVACAAAAELAIDGFEPCVWPDDHSTEELHAARVFMRAALEAVIGEICR